MKYISAEEALSVLRDGDHIHWPCVSAVPERNDPRYMFDAELTIHL